MDAAVVLTGAGAAVSQALRSLKRCGTLVLVGLAHGTVEFPALDGANQNGMARERMVGSKS